jgi:pimeloyl-ACP methyl ester carboxylesterase
MRIKGWALTGIALILLQADLTTAGQPYEAEFVVLLHGLARTRDSMARMGRSLSDEGYRVLNLGYPSRSKTIEAITDELLPGAIAHCRQNGARRIHFVTHSMGGIIVRHYLSRHGLPELGRVVMLSPPNGGSEVVDTFRNNWFFQWLNGPAGQELGTGEDSLPRRLGPVDFQLGVITGDRSINWILSLIIPGKDDGKVSVVNARVAGMRAFLVIHATHPFIMKNREAIRQTLAFLATGRFLRE